MPIGFCSCEQPQTLPTHPLIGSVCVSLLFSGQNQSAIDIVNTLKTPEIDELNVPVMSGMPGTHAPETDESTSVEDNLGVE